MLKERLESFGKRCKYPKIFFDMLWFCIKNLAQEVECYAVTGGFFVGPAHFELTKN
jgi:hypothetical protein